MLAAVNSGKLLLIYVIYRFLQVSIAFIELCFAWSIYFYAFNEYFKTNLFALCIFKIVLDSRPSKSMMPHKDFILFKDGVNSLIVYSAVIELYQLFKLYFPILCKKIFKKHFFFLLKVRIVSEAG